MVTWIVAPVPTIVFPGTVSHSPTAASGRVCTTQVCPAALTKLRCNSVPLASTAVMRNSDAGDEAETGVPRISILRVLSRAAESHVAPASKELLHPKAAAEPVGRVAET